MSAEKRWKRLTFRWTAPKGFLAMALFFTLALLIEYCIVHFFLSSGLSDKSLFIKTFQVPLTNVFFTIPISPIFHLIPFGVIVVLVSSWMYLKKYVAVMPRRVEPVKKLVTPRKRPSRPLKNRLKPIRRFSRMISKKFQKMGRILKALYQRASTAVLRIHGVSYVTQRLFFARATVKSTASVLAIFLASVLALYMLGYPRLLHDVVVEFYKGNPSFHMFVLNTIETAQATAQALSPIWWLTSTLNNALLATAPSFQSSLESLGAPITAPIVKLDLVWKYALCQYFAAWISAVTALLYGRYTSRFYRPYKL